MERPDFQTLKSPKTHEPIDIEHNRGITGGLHPMCKLGYFYPRGGGCICVKLVIIRVFFQTPLFLPACAPVEIALLDRFSWFLWIKGRVSASSTLFLECEPIYIYIFVIFAKKIRRIPYSRNVYFNRQSLLFYRRQSREVRVDLYGGGFRQFLLCMRRNFNKTTSGLQFYARFEFSVPDFIYGGKF